MIDALLNILLLSLDLAEFIVVDDAVVRAKDLGNNFFVTQEAIGKPRAQEIVQNLLELNPTSVKGSAILKSPKIIVDNEKENFWKKFQLVIATQLMEESLRKLAEVLYPLNIPFIHVVVNGLVGICRIAIREHQSTTLLGL